MSPDDFERMLRSASRAAHAGLTADELDRAERAVMRRTGAPGNAALPAWLPATAAAAVLGAGMFLLGRWPESGPVPVPPPAGSPELVPVMGTAGLSRVARERFGLALDVPVRRVVLADFERFADPAVMGLTEGARIDLLAGAASGSYSLQLPANEDGVRLAVPAGDRLSVAGVSAWMRGSTRGVSVELTALLEDGTSLTIPGLRLDPAGWRLALFPLDPERVRAGGGVRELRFAVAGREEAGLDRIEVWTTSGEGRR